MPISAIYPQPVALAERPSPDSILAMRSRGGFGLRALFKEAI
eukprot:gene11300-13835_t